MQGSESLSFRKDQFCFKHIRELCGQAKPTTEMLYSSGDPEHVSQATSRLLHLQNPRSFDRMCFLFTMSDKRRQPEGAPNAANLFKQEETLAAKLECPAFRGS